MFNFRYPAIIYPSGHPASCQIATAGEMPFCHPWAFPLLAAPIHWGPRHLNQQAIGLVHLRIFLAHSICIASTTTHA
jgi:hypothetical protein